MGGKIMVDKGEVVNEAINVFEKLKEADGKVPLEVFWKMKEKWGSLGFSGEEFETTFAKYRR